MYPQYASLHVYAFIKHLYASVCNHKTSKRFPGAISDGLCQTNHENHNVVQSTPQHMHHVHNFGSEPSPKSKATPDPVKRCAKIVF